MPRYILPRELRGCCGSTLPMKKKIQLVGFYLLFSVFALFSTACVLTITATGNGNGTVSVAPAALNTYGICTVTAGVTNGCQHDYGGASPTVTLTASPYPDSRFDYWDGACVNQPT